MKAPPFLSGRARRRKKSLPGPRMGLSLTFTEDTFNEAVEILRPDFPGTRVGVYPVLDHYPTHMPSKG